MTRAQLDNVISRLENWKFLDAASQLVLLPWNDQPPATIAADTVSLTVALSSSYGNCGWFEGDQGKIVQAATQRVIDELRACQEKLTG